MRWLTVKRQSKNRSAFSKSSLMICTLKILLISESLKKPSSAAPLFHVSIRYASNRYFLTATPLIFVITPPLKTQARARDRESTSKVIPSSFSEGFSSRQSISSLPFQGILTQGAKPDFSPGFPLSSTNARNKKRKNTQKNRRRRLQTRLLSYACSCSV